MRYNFACALGMYLNDKEATLEMVKTLLTTATRPLLDYLKADPDFELLHDDSRYRAILAVAEARLAVGPTAAAKPEAVKAT